jgi:trehalose-phosphatase
MSGDSGQVFQSAVEAAGSTRNARPFLTHRPSTFVSAVHACRAALASRPAGLLTDVDGTISPIVQDPSTAKVLPGCRDALATLARQIDFVGVLSGRRAEDARAMVGVDGIEYFGVHGMVRWTPEGTLVHAEAAEFVTLIDDAYADIMQRLHLPGIIVEHKGPCLAVHYRQTADPQAAREHVLQELQHIADEDALVVAEGRMVIELRPPPPFGKGWLVEDLAAERSLASLVCLGDDRTDIDAFHALRAWRGEADGRCGVALAVASPEMPAMLFEAADYVLDDVPAVELLLRQLALPESAERLL